MNTPDTLTSLTTLTLDNRLRAKFLYWLGWKIAEIADALEENDRTVQAWKTREEWDKNAPHSRVEQALETRLICLIFKEKKSSGDKSEIDLLMRELERTARIEHYKNSGKEVDLNPKLSNGGKAKAEKAKSIIKNDLSPEQIETLKEAFHDSLYNYQRDWLDAGDQRTRIILKSRQIGATYYFAHEAFIDALITGRNQIFLSASKAQAHVFKNYIQQFVRSTIGVEINGNPIILPNGAELHFLGTNYRTAQSYHGNFYFDEFFWVHGFNELNKVASGMAMHDKWRKTYFSTPSTVTHEAYTFWTGTYLNKGKPKKDHVKIDISHDSLRDGRLCEDYNWRQIVNIYDAERGGCDLFNIERLKFEYSPEAFANLLMCQFIDDGQSMFPLAMLQSCMVDSHIIWEEDYKPFAARPFGSRQVWVGYDPSESGDSAGVVVLAPPAVQGGKFRVLERHQLKGDNFAEQAEFIRQITLRYWVTYIGIDKTGIGSGVFQLVQGFFPNATPFHYSPEVKTLLVMKTLDVIRNGRLEFDAGAIDLAQSLMAIKKTLTKSQTQMTYTATRSDEIGHADLAWALMHAMFNEPLEGQTQTNTGFMEIY